MESGYQKNKNKFIYNRWNLTIKISWEIHLFFTCLKNSKYRFMHVHD